MVGTAIAADTNRHEGTGVTQESPTIRPIAQSAVVPYRVVGATVRVLLVTTKISSRWVVPKGMIEPGLTPAASAVKEAMEEGGVLGVVTGGCLGRYRYIKRRPGRSAHCVVQVFPMHVTAVLTNWSERTQRRRAWMDLVQAQACVREPGLRRIIATLGSRLAPRVPGRPTCFGNDV